MANFQPVEPNFLAKVSKSPITYIIFASTLLGLSFVYVRESRQRELSERIEYLQDGPLIIERSSDGAETNGSQELTSTESDSNVEQIPTSTTSSLVDSSSDSQTRSTGLESFAEKTTTSTESASTSGESLTNSTSTKPKFVKLIFAEVSKGFLKSVQDGLKKNGLYQRLETDLFWGIFKLGQFELNENPEIRVLDTMTIGLAPQIEWSKPALRDSDIDPQTPGISGTITQLSATDQSIKFESEIVKVQRSPEGALQRRSFPYVFEAKSNDVYILSGILTPGPGNEVNALEASSVYQIMSSEKFQKNESELTIFYVFQDISDESSLSEQ